MTTRSSSPVYANGQRSSDSALGSSRSETSTTTALSDPRYARRRSCVPTPIPDNPCLGLGTSMALPRRLEYPQRSWGTTVTATRSLRPEHNAVRTARAFCTAQLRAEVTGGLSPYAMEDLAGDAAMVVSELVTNAIRAGASTIRLDVGRVGGLFRI